MILASSMLIATEDSKEGIIRKELKKLEGTWVPTSGKADGSVASPKELRKMKVVIARGKWVLHFEGKTAEANFKIDPMKKPKTIDLYPKAAKGQMVVGIYLLDGDTLKICLPEPSTRKKRPKEFSGEKGQSLTIFERQKPK
jgi:uncharacterized protein (TIGR03067 family)